MADVARRPLRNGAHGYGLVTRTLHWVMVAAIFTQFAIGFSMGARPGGGRGKGSGDRSRYEPFGSNHLLTVHVILGSVILTLAVIRLVWRWTTPLPPWADTLTAGERTLAHWTERALYGLMFAIPLTGLWLVLEDDDDARWPHVLSHIAFFIVFVLHISLVVKHQLVDRDRLLQRML